MPKSTPSSPNKPTPQTSAADRISQITNHISTPASTPTSTPPPNKKRPKPKPTTTLPADYSDILTTIHTLQTLAQTPSPTNPGYIRQKQAGKLWVRERIALLLDPGSFREIGSIAGTVTWSPSPSSSPSAPELPTSFTPTNNLHGLGRLQNRRILLTADDFTLRAGHADGGLQEKTIYIEKLSLSLRLPIIKLVDGSSGGGSVTTIKTMGYAYIPPMPTFEYVVKQLNAGIPNLGAVLGPAIGLGAARVVACHWSVMAGDVGGLVNAGGKVVAGATFEEGLTFTDLGGPAVHCTNGTIDNLAANEQECFEQIRTILGYLPNSGSSLPPVTSCDDPIDRLCTDLRTIIPRRKARMYNPRTIITSVVDAKSWFEIGALWGTTAIVGLARLAGRPIGIISLNCEVNAGALDAGGSQKITRHLKFCDIFNVPILQFVDVPGYAIGTVAEKQATMRHGVALATTYYSTTVPVFSVVTRKAYGVAGGIMLDCRDPRFRVAWPSGEWGSLPPEGGIEAGHAAELKAVGKEGEGKRKERYKELEEEYLRLMNPVRTANAFGVEEIIDPAVTRRLVCEWLVHV
ncbi:putative propionyl- carboxylase beta mitochondrial precursor protein [Rutstroemia sp. NJR-2017a WRK4]|nr:putative propionyl- carboxylase beta mitochondrial precursor protein [Rutstroemia sp. NJR-2017a WRK4]